MFSSKIRSGAECAPKVLTLLLSVSLLLCVLCAMTLGQASPSNPPGSSGELYGGIELSNEGVKVIALQVTQTDDEPTIKSIYSEMIRLRLGRAYDGELQPQASTDNRNTSALIHNSNDSTQAGYEMLKYSSSDSPSFDFVAMSIPQGVISYANEVSKAVGLDSSLFTFTRQVKTTSASSFRQALRKELESKPNLMHRKRVFLTGNLAWAVATMLYPEDRQPLVSITYDDIMQFAERIARDPKELALRNLTFIRDRKLRKEVEQEFEAIRATFKPQELIAGAEMLKVAAQELKWQDKKILFARLGHLGCILSYTRLKIIK